MKVFRRISPLRKYIHLLKPQNKSIGLVPTMGALHEGHLSLVREARKRNDIVVVSIFVNPTQFGHQEDYLKYPRPFKKDKELCQREGVDVIFVPEVKEMYPENYLTYVNVEKLNDRLCGKFRPGHFRGVATVVTKLLNIVQPDRAYFGEKDFQQLQVIKKLAKDLNLPCRIIGCPIIRESDGLAMSSRNIYLSKKERKDSPAINQALRTAGNLINDKKVRSAKRIISAIKKIISAAHPRKIDYIKICDPETFEDMKNIRKPALISLAVWFGKARLIDNSLIK